MNNILLFLKDGGIHIKKKNKGKFTNYCNGKVTLECINRGKHSSNPITRKRATFADNARHWVKKGLNGLAIQLGVKIKMLDINGNWVWLDTTTGQTSSITPLTGTIQVNATRSVGGDKNTKRGRTLIAHNLVLNYNNRQTKVHNYGDLTRRLKLKRLTVSVDNTGEPIINLTDYNPGVEAPMKPYTPLEEFYVGAKALDLPFKFGNKAIQYGLGRYGSKFGWNEALLSARNKILSDVFDRQSLKLITPLTTTLLYLTLKFTPTIVSPNKEGALTFFLRKPSKISIAERMGIPKGEGDNTSKYILNTQAKVSDILSNQSLLTQDILEGAMQGYKDALKYYNSDQYLNHLINTGLSREKALELQKFKIGNLLDTKINFNNIDPNAYGHNVIETATGSSRTELNPAMSNTRSLARETTWHESGGHASSKNYKLEHQPIIDRDTYLRNIYANSFYRKISEHNKELIPELKPQWKAYLNGDMDTFNKLATKEDYQIINKYKNPKEFINYINDEQEAAARAISANIGDFVGLPSQWNLPQLETFFTKDGIKKLRNNVWNVGTSLGGGVVFEQIDYNPETKE